MASSPRKLPPPQTCPVCGEDVPPKALACPECEADHNSGWREDAVDGVDLSGDDFDYEEFLRDEFGGGTRPKHIHPVWWITAILLLIAFLRWALM